MNNEEGAKVDEITSELGRLALQVHELGFHRSYSIAVTKIEEAMLWLQDRKNKV